MTPTPKTTLFTTPQTTLNKHPNLHLRGKETQEAYLLHLHDHNCIKNSRHLPQPRPGNRPQERGWGEFYQQQAIAFVSSTENQA